MQSGISASTALHSAFQSLLTSPTSKRGLLIGIENESLVPLDFLTLDPSSSSSTSTDHSALLSRVRDILPDREARYLALRIRDSATSAPAAAADNGDKAAGHFAAITWIPSSCPVRQRMLFASTRLTLVRELGAAHFGVTTLLSGREEVDAVSVGLVTKSGDDDGGKGRGEGGAAGAVLTSGEREERALREAEEEARNAKAHEADMGMGTGGRKQVGGGKLGVKVGEGVLEGLRDVVVGEGGSVVALKIDIPTETTLLATPPAPMPEPASLTSILSSSEPRYLLYKPAASTSATSPFLFIYHCPSASKIKERMLFAATKRSVQDLVAEECAASGGGAAVKSIEASDEEEVREGVEEALKAAAAAASGESVGGEQSSGGASRGFSKPKRPGRR